MMHSPLIQAHKVALKAVSEFKVKLYFIPTKVLTVLSRVIFSPGRSPR